jgi:RNA polymerase sigma factor (sigma-70 family)
MNRDRNETERLVEQLRTGEVEAIEGLYHRFFPGLNRFVRNNKGTVEDARDLFQECLYYLYRNLNRPEGLAIDNLEAYFRAMYRNRWFQYLANKTRTQVTEQDYGAWETNEEDIYYYAYIRAFNSLNDDCRQVLEYYVEGKNTREIADLLGTTLDYAKRKKYLCKEKLKEIAEKLMKVYHR